MTAVATGLVTLGCVFTGAVSGMALGRVLPVEHRRDDTKDAVKLAAGMISLMAALVLGLLVGSAKSTFDSANEAVIQGGARVIVLDRVLADYGPEAARVRARLRRAVASRVEMLWPHEHPTAFGMPSFERATPVERLLDEIRALDPHTDAQRTLRARAQALADEIVLSRWVQVEQAQTPLPPALLAILLFWLTILYASFGLVAPRNRTVLATMFLGALAVATAVFLVVEMNGPMDGVIRVSSAPLRKTLEFLGR